MMGLALHHASQVAAPVRTQIPAQSATQGVTESAGETPGGAGRAGFYARIVPLAQREGEVEVYSYAASFPPFWERAVIPGFERKYGIKVRFFNSRSGIADHQLEAQREFGRPAPTDVYFAPRGHLDFYVRHDLASHIDLASALPEAGALARARLRDLPPDGYFVPFHVNQSALAIDDAYFASTAATAPATLEELLNWAVAHPKKFALTSPRYGGSGGAFLIAVANHFMDPPCRAAFFSHSMTADAARNWVAHSGCLDGTWRYFKQLYPVSEVTRGNADTQNLLANRAAAMGTVWEDWSYTFIKYKLLQPTLRLSVVPSGMPGSADVLFVASGARHPAAAMLLIDYLLSAPMQQWKLDELRSRSARTDVVAASRDAASAGNMLPVSLDGLALPWPPAATMEALGSEFARQVVIGQ